MANACRSCAGSPLASCSPSWYFSLRPRIMNKLLFVLLALVLARVAFAAVQTDVEYGNVAGESLKLDASVPDGAGPFPAVILVHGGGWTGGDKSGGPKKAAYMVPMHEPLERARFAWFSINYRLAPKYRYPACIEDVETAIRWIKSHAAEYRIDPRRIAISGESAGGHLVALAAVRADESTRLAAIVPFYGPFDLSAPLKPGEPVHPAVVALFGPMTPEEPLLAIRREGSPLLHVKRGLPPFLLVHGTGDKTVPYEQSIALQEKLGEAGVPCELLTIQDGAHGMINWENLAPDYKERIVAWLKRTLAVGENKTE
jgi:acetyl esterase/lipase